MPAPVRKRRKKSNTKPGYVALYGIGLLAAALILYSTLFTRAYTDPMDNPVGQNPTSQVQPDDNPLFTRPSKEPEYKTYPDTGEKVATVLIDAGHGGIDSGKPTDSGVLEKDLNLTMALKMGQYLQELNPQIEVKYIRTDDNVFWGDVETEDLNYRLAQQWEQNADYFISLHCNAYEGDDSVEGTVFFINPDDPVTKALSEKFRDNMAAINWAENFQIIDYELLQVVTMSDIHSILIELGYMTNPSDLARLTDEGMQNMVAKALAAGISDYIMENPDAPKYTNPRFYRGERLNKDSSASSSSQAADPAAQTPAP